MGSQANTHKLNKSTRCIWFMLKYTSSYKWALRPHSSFETASFLDDSDRWPDHELYSNQCLNSWFCLIQREGHSCAEEIIRWCLSKHKYIFYGSCLRWVHYFSGFGAKLLLISLCTLLLIISMASDVTLCAVNYRSCKQRWDCFVLRRV